MYTKLSLYIYIYTFLVHYKMFARNMHVFLQIWKSISTYLLHVCNIYIYILIYAHASVSGSHFMFSIYVYIYI